MLRNKILFVFIFLGFFSLAIAQDEFVYDSKGKRNPFIPLVTSDGRLMKLEKETESAGRSGLLVDGIIYDKNGLSYAIVNGNVVGVGDYVGEYRVLKIEANKIAFLKEDQIIEVVITKEENK